MNDSTDAHDGSEKPGLPDHLKALVSASRDWFTDSLGLILLDGQLAGVSLVRMLIYGLVASVLFLTGWLALMLAASFYLHRLGLPMEMVILGVGIVTIALGVFLVFRITALSANMTFQTSRHYFSSNSETAGDGDNDREAGAAEPGEANDTLAPTSTTRESSK